MLVLGHTGRSGVPFDVDEVLTVAKERHKLIEVNEHSLEGDHKGDTHDACRRIAERCAELGVGIWFPAIVTSPRISVSIPR